MTKTITLTIGEAEIAMQAIAKYSQIMESNQENKWLSEGTVEIVKSIISQLEQTEEEIQTFGKLEACISSHLTPEELSNYSLSDVSITLINNNTGEKSAVEVESFDLTDLQWIDEDKNEEKTIELAKLILPIAQKEEEVYYEQSPKWVLALEQQRGDFITNLRGMSDDIEECLNGTYFSFDEYGDKVPSNKNESYEDMLRASVGYLREAAKDIEYREDLCENKLMPAYEDTVDAYNKVLELYKNAISKSEVAINELETTIMGLAKDQQEKVNSLLDAKDKIIVELINKLK